MRTGLAVFTVFIYAAIGMAPPALGQDGKRLYRQHCAECHGEDRLGAIGPAMLPQNLGRLKRDAAAAVVRDGAPASQMPAFKSTLSDAEIASLLEFIYSPLGYVPRWDITEINSSYVASVTDQSDAGLARPVYDADPLNLFVVVEAGDHHVTILDGDKFEPLYRFKSRHALHGGPKFSSNGRFVYLASRDGWITKFDLYTLQTVAEVRAGINTRNLAVSSDDRFVLVGNYLPHTLVLLDAEKLRLLKIIPVEDGRGQSSRVSAVYDAAPRQSFIAALKDLKEVWEIPYAENPPYYGMVHDYRYEGPPTDVTKFPVRRIRLDDYLDDFFFDQNYTNIVGAARNAKNGQVVSLIVGRKIADIPLTGLPHLGSGVSWRYDGAPVFATPHLQENAVTVIDTHTWKSVKKIKTLGPGFFMRTHEASDYAWVDVFFGPHRDVVHVIDKRSLEIVKTIRPAIGKVAAHVEFTRDGRFALLSIWDMDGAIVVYDAKTLEEVKRIPLVKPSGKYNVYNKITRSEGTSH